MRNLSYSYFYQSRQFAWVKSKPTVVLCRHDGHLLETERKCFAHIFLTILNILLDVVDLIRCEESFGCYATLAI